jgi:hypothetical protein
VGLAVRGLPVLARQVGGLGGDAFSDSLQFVGVGTMIPALRAVKYTISGITVLIRGTAAWKWDYTSSGSWSGGVLQSWSWRTGTLWSMGF